MGFINAKFWFITNKEDAKKMHIDVTKPGDIHLIREVGTPFLSAEDNKNPTFSFYGYTFATEHLISWQDLENNDKALFKIVNPWKMPVIVNDILSQGTAL